MVSSQQSFFKMILHPVRMRIFLCWYLPSAFFSGVRPVKADESSCTVRVPYRWFTRNPFRSTYFACLAMAAEMSTGVLALSLLYRQTPAVSMLVTDLHAEYFKKAVDITYFTCSDGLGFKSVIEQAMKDGLPHTFTAATVGYTAKGEKVASFRITWSFKTKSIAAQAVKD